MECSDRVLLAIRSEVHSAAAPCSPSPLTCSSQTPNPYLGDPTGWVAATTGKFMWSKQREIDQLLECAERAGAQEGHARGQVTPEGPQRPAVRAAEDLDVPAVMVLPRPITTTSIPNQ